MPVKVGQIVEGVVSGITGFGAFVEISEEQTGMVHISEIADTYVKDINNHLSIDDKVRVKVLSIEGGGRISLSIRAAKQDEESFEKNLAEFMKESEDRLSDLKNREAKRSGGFRGRG
ncbi:MAG: S1 RNA-binding domain-containing protein [Clostridiales bacterium]|nr:S1 RNA-binding domain-containing protein [Clostridiales bacterium]